MESFKRLPVGHAQFVFPTATSSRNQCPTLEESFRTGIVPCVSLLNGLDYFQTRELSRKYLVCRDKQQCSVYEDTYCVFWVCSASSCAYGKKRRNSNADYSSTLVEGLLNREYLIDLLTNDIFHDPQALPDRFVFRGLFHFVQGNRKFTSGMLKIILRHYRVIYFRAEDDASLAAQ